MSRQWQDDHGFMTFAVGPEYLRAARAQAMTVKLTQDVKNFAVVVDQSASKNILDEDVSMFDKIIVIDHIGEGWDMTREWMAFNLSPWQHTIKTDADLLFTASVDHWWTALQHRDVCMATSIRDFRGDIITSRWHRKLFDENNLPNVYSAMTYFRYSRGASDFFDKVRKISEDWAWYATELLIKNDDPRPRTDEIFAIASMLLGVENTQLPTDQMPTFTHMKERLNQLRESQPWYEQIPSYWHEDKLFVGNIAQQLPFHYHQKDWMSDELYSSIYRNYSKLHQSI